MKSDKDILQLVDDDKVYWCKREGGSQPYLIHRKRLHELVTMGLVVPCEAGCCYREYYLTDLGKIALNKLNKGETINEVRPY